jgi:hypothetical protein
MKSQNRISAALTTCALHYEMNPPYGFVPVRGKHAPHCRIFQWYIYGQRAPTYNVVPIQADPIRHLCLQMKWSVLTFTLGLTSNVLAIDSFILHMKCYTAFLPPVACPSETPRAYAFYGRLDEVN